MKILLAEDDARLGHFLQKLFRSRDVEIDWIDTGDEIEFYAQQEDYDVLVLDWMLPGKDGVAACRSLRNNGYQGAIIMLTARTTLADKITGLDCGADDYLTKPFEFDELYARINALSRRASKSFQHEVFRVDSCAFDCLEHTVSCLDLKIQMTAREFQLAEILARNHGQVLERELLLDRVWGSDKDITSNSLDAYMKLVRKKLEKIPGKVFIHNIRSVGYRWEEKNV